VFLCVFVQTLSLLLGEGQWLKRGTAKVRRPAAKKLGFGTGNQWVNGEDLISAWTSASTGRSIDPTLPSTSNWAVPSRRNGTRPEYLYGCLCLPWILSILGARTRAICAIGGCKHATPTGVSRADSQHPAFLFKTYLTQ
jgi:hypothetical protein